MREFDVVVIGAGPAGMAAALAASTHRASTLLIDENEAIGGQLRLRLTPTLEGELGFDLTNGIGPAVAAQLEQQLREQARLTIETDTVAWGLFNDNVLGLSTENEASQVRANAIIVATGSTDVALPFPGWTLPGVMTTRAIQIFMHLHRVLPGDRWAILGDTEEAREVRADLERSGARVVCMIDDPESMRASGTNRLAHVETGVDVFEVDGLVIALGRQPDPELALQARVEFGFDWDLGGHVPVLTDDRQTSQAGLYVAGDAAGIASIPELLAEGWLAGLHVANAPERAVDEARARLDAVANQTRQAAQARIEPVLEPHSESVS